MGKGFKPFDPMHCDTGGGSRSLFRNKALGTLESLLALNLA